VAIRVWRTRLFETGISFSCDPSNSCKSPMCWEHNVVNAIWAQRPYRRDIGVQPEPLEKKTRSRAPQRRSTRKKVPCRYTIMPTIARSRFCSKTVRRECDHHGRCNIATSARTCHSALDNLSGPNGRFQRIGQELQRLRKLSTVARGPE
jgi:hypothetical protein